jgi:hypothetical protein
METKSAAAADPAETKMADPDIFERFKEEIFPECFQEYADLLSSDKYWRTTQQPALLEVVRRGKASRLLQLRRPPRGQEQEHGSLHLGAGARG